MYSVVYGLSSSRCGILGNRAFSRPQNLNDSDQGFEVTEEALRLVIALFTVFSVIDPV